MCWLGGVSVCVLVGACCLLCVVLCVVCGVLYVVYCIVCWCVGV